MGEIVFLRREEAQLPIPIVRRHQTKRGQMRQLQLEMKLGESVLVPDSYAAKSFMELARVQLNALGDRRFSRRTQPDGTVRIWRVK